MTPYLSNKLRNLSAIAILMVIYIHMFYTEGQTMGLLAVIEQFVGGGMCAVAVPLFYVISGYLFFLSMPGGVRAVKGKLKKRCRTLLVPYLIANTLTFLFYLSLSLIALKVAAIGRVVNFNVLDVIKTSGLWGTLELVFITPPIAFQLWFVRDLMCVMLLSPLIYLSINQLNKMGGGKIWLIFIGVLFVFLYNVWPVTAFVWFSLGGYIAICGADVQAARKFKGMSVGFVAVYVAVSLGCAVGALPEEVGHYIPLVGIPALWLAYDVISGCFDYERIKWLTGCSFFIYLIHEPLLNVFKKLPLLFSRSEPTLIVCYLVIPPLFYLFGCVLAAALKRWTPKAYSVYTGGR